MAAKSIANRRTSKRAPAPELTDVSLDPFSWKRLELREPSGGILSAVLGLSARMPMLRCDPKRAEVLGAFDAKAKSNLLYDIETAVSGATSGINIIGKLMSAYDASTGYMTDEDRVEIGFTISSLAGIIEELTRARQEIEEAVPVGAGAVEAQEASSAAAGE